MATLKNPPQFGLWAETRPHEVEIISNRKSLCYGEDLPNSAHTAHHGRKMYMRGHYTLILLWYFVYTPTTAG